MYVIMPLVAVALVTAFDLHPAVKIALVALSVSPVPPILPRKELKALKAGGSSEYRFGMLVAPTVLAIVVIPLSIKILDQVFVRSIAMPVGPIAVLVFTTALAPLALGIFIREVMPTFAGRIVKPVGLIGLVLLILGILPVLFKAMPAIVSLIGNGTLLAIVVFVLLALVAGHWLGGPEPENRPVLALSTASRHPGVALAIAHTNFPEVKLAAAAILLYMLVSAIVSKPYMTWWRRKHPGSVDIPPAKTRHA
jgi:BASS family bile acid:Na+ symporter